MRIRRPSVAIRQSGGVRPVRGSRTRPSGACHAEDLVGAWRGDEDLVAVADDHHGLAALPSRTTSTSARYPRRSPGEPWAADLGNSKIPDDGVGGPFCVDHAWAVRLSGESPGE